MELVEHDDDYYRDKLLKALEKLNEASDIINDLLTENKLSDLKDKHIEMLHAINRQLQNEVQEDLHTYIETEFPNEK